MRYLLLIPALVLLINKEAQSQASALSDKAPRVEICLAKTAGSEISVQSIFKDPVLSLCTTAGEIGGFEFSFVAVTAKFPDSVYQGPFIVKGNALNGAGLAQLKSFAALGRITKMFIDNIQIIAVDGTPGKIYAAKFYKVNE